MKFSIITVSYNSQVTIANTIDSVLKQDYDNIEYIIVDGGSSDNTLGIISESRVKLLGRQIDFKLISEKDNGIYDAINKGIRISTGDIVGILNSDDAYYDDLVISKIAACFNNNDIDCVYGNLKYVDKNTNHIKRVWRSKEFKKGLFYKSWTPAHPTFYCKKEIYNKYGLYKTNYKIASDVELMFRYLEIHAIRSLYLNEYFINMSTGGVSNNGLSSKVQIIKEMKKAFNENNKKVCMISYLFWKLTKIREFVFRKGE